MSISIYTFVRCFFIYTNSLLIFIEPTNKKKQWQNMEFKQQQRPSGKFAYYAFTSIYQFELF